MALRNQGLAVDRDAGPVRESVIDQAEVPERSDKRRPRRFFELRRRRRYQRIVDLRRRRSSGEYQEVSWAVRATFTVRKNELGGSQ